MSRAEGSSNARRSSVSLSPWTLSRLLDQPRAHPLKLGAGNLHIDEGKRRHSREGNRKGERERKAKGLGPKDLTDPHRV